MSDPITSERRSSRWRRNNSQPAPPRGARLAPGLMRRLGSVTRDCSVLAFPKCKSQVGALGIDFPLGSSHTWGRTGLRDERNPTQNASLEPGTSSA